MLPLEWEPASVTPALNALTTIRASVEAGRSLKDAIRLLDAGPTETAAEPWRPQLGRAGAPLPISEAEQRCPGEREHLGEGLFAT